MKRRPTLRETIAKNQATMDLYAAMSAADDALRRGGIL